MYLINQRKLGSSESQQTIKAEVDPDYSSKIATHFSGHPPAMFLLRVITIWRQGNWRVGQEIDKSMRPDNIE